MNGVVPGLALKGNDPLANSPAQAPQALLSQGKVERSKTKLSQEDQLLLPWLQKELASHISQKFNQ